MKTRDAAKGFSLMEVILTIAIFIVVFQVILYLFTGYQKTYNTQQALVSMNEAARLSMNEIQSNLLEATQVLSSYAFSSGTYNSSSTVLVLELPSKDSSGDTITGKYDHVVFYTSGSKLYRLTQSDASSARASGLRQLTANLSAITFTFDSADFTQVASVNVSLSSRTQSSGKTMNSTLQQQINLRNK